MPEQISDAERAGVRKAIVALLDAAKQCADLSQKFGEGSAMKRATSARAEIYQDAADLLATEFGFKKGRGSEG